MRSALRLIPAVLATVFSLVAGDSNSWDPGMYACALCEDAVKLTRQATSADSNFGAAFNHICARLRACELFDSTTQTRLEWLLNTDQSALEVCVSVRMCDNEPYTSYLEESASPLQLRVSRGNGARGNYSLMRVSVVTAGPVAEYDALFDYRSAFKYRWTNNYLYSSLISLQVGDNILQIGDVAFSISLPAPGAGVRGVVIADPCVSARWVSCYYRDAYQTYNHTAALLNVFMSDSSTSFYMIHGDNFYDKTGELTRSFYNQLTLNTQSKILATTAGNHDYWVYGSPSAATWDDQYGNGYMQWYAQDSEAALKTELFDFSVDPDGSNTTSQRLASWSNFFWYNTLGNIGVVGYSGAYDYATVESKFAEACEYFVQTDVSLALLVGHWNVPGDGCAADMAVPETFAAVINLPSCAMLGNKLRYVMGHTHCNSVKQQGSGFMVAGQGMSGCGNYGVPVFDTTNGRFRILYFGIQDESGLDVYDEVISCVQTYGIDGCTRYATVWIDEDLATLGA